MTSAPPAYRSLDPYTNKPTQRKSLPLSDGEFAISRDNWVLVFGGCCLVISHILGLINFLIRRVLLNSPLAWENPLYYYNNAFVIYWAHFAVSFAFLYLAGPFLLVSKFNSKVFCMYWVLFFLTSIVTSIPLLVVGHKAFGNDQRIPLGVAICEHVLWPLILFSFAAYLCSPNTHNESRSVYYAFHVLCGYKVVVKLKNVNDTSNQTQQWTTFFFTSLCHQYDYPIISSLVAGIFLVLHVALSRYLTKTWPRRDLCPNKEPVSYCSDKKIILLFAAIFGFFVIMDVVIITTSKNKK